MSGMFFVSRPIRCEMKRQKIPPKPEHELVTTKTKQRAGFFLTTNLQKPNYRIRNRPRSECKYVGWSRLLDRKKKKKKCGSKTTNYSQLAWSFELHVKQTPVNIACDWLILFALRRVSSRVWSYLPDLTLLCDNISFISVLCLKLSRNRKRKFQYLKTVKLKICRGRKSQLVVSWQVMTIPCCGLAVIFCGLISHMIGQEAINIPEIFPGVHGFTGKTVNNRQRLKLSASGKH